MSDETNKINPGAANEQTPMANRAATIILAKNGWSKDDGGYEISTQAISSITVKENMFAKLPTATIVFTDDGSIIHGGDFSVGEKLFLTITPGSDKDDVIYKPYLKCSFIIEDITYVLDPEHQIYNTTLNCIYDAEAYLCNVIRWPIENDLDVTNLERQFTSEAVLSDVCQAGGLKFSCELEEEPDDKMTWINVNKTCSEFAQYIVEHAWIDDEDLPLLYVDVEGNAVYTSLNTLAEAPTRAQYMNTIKFQKKYEDKSTNNDMPASYVRLYSSAVIYNVGHSLLNGAYGMKHYIYNPYNTEELSLVDFMTTNDNTEAVTNNDFYSRYKVFWDQDPDAFDPEEDDVMPHAIRIGKVSNKSPGGIGTRRWYTSSTKFMETHEYFDYAKWHNKVLRDAWCQQVAYITVTTNEQMSLDADGQHVHLGDKIEVDYSTVDVDTSLQSNKYIVGGITHFWSKGGAYTLKISCVSDGIGGKGE